MLPYVFTEHAKADVVKQVLYYEAKQEGLGIRFLDEVLAAAAKISSLPTGYASYYKLTRERKTDHFPYKLIYTIEEGIIFIHAVYPSKANPKNKYKRVKRSKRKK